VLPRDAATHVYLGRLHSTHSAIYGVTPQAATTRTATTTLPTMPLTPSSYPIARHLDRLSGATGGPAGVELRLSARKSIVLNQTRRVHHASASHTNTVTLITVAILMTSVMKIIQRSRLRDSLRAYSAR
jgi:hypothetical protein